MSAAGRSERGGEGRDLFPTPPDLAAVLAALFPFAGRVLEPSAGPGRIVRALNLRGVTPDAVELHPSHQKQLAPLCARVTIGSFLHYGRDPRERGYDWIIGNPPFAGGRDHIAHALYLLRPGGVLAFILPASILTPAAARPLRAGLARRYELEERPGFTDDGQTDASDYAIFVWKRGYRAETITRYISWRGANAAADLQQCRDYDWPMWRATVT